MVRQDYFSSILPPSSNIWQLGLQPRPRIISPTALPPTTISCPLSLSPRKMLPLVALFSLLSPLTLALPCVQFDATWNLYAFGGAQDVKLGMSSSWACKCTSSSFPVTCLSSTLHINLVHLACRSDAFAAPSATPLSTDGRPPWTGNYSQCLLSQYNNAMYVLGGDSSDLSVSCPFNNAALSQNIHT